MGNGEARAGLRKRHGEGQGERHCQGPAPAALWKGIDQFNRHQFFACHETLEVLWLEERRDLRNFYQGIIQVAVGCYHLLRDNYGGAMAQWRKGRARLEPFAPCCMGVEVARLVRDTAHCQAHLQALGPARLCEFDLALLPTIAYRMEAKSQRCDTAGKGGGFDD